jgi:hypothetical protein
MKNIILSCLLLHSFISYGFLNNVYITTRAGVGSLGSLSLDLQQGSTYTEFDTREQFYYEISSGTTWFNSLDTQLSFQHFLSRATINYIDTVRQDDSEISMMDLSFDLIHHLGKNFINTFYGAGVGISYNTLDKLSRNQSGFLDSRIPGDSNTSLAAKGFFGIEVEGDHNLKHSLRFSYVHHGKAKLQNTLTYMQLDKKQTLTAAPISNNLGSIVLSYGISYNFPIKQDSLTQEPAQEKQSPQPKPEEHQPEAQKPEISAPLQH